MEAENYSSVAEGGAPMRRVGPLGLHEAACTEHMLTNGAARPLCRPMVQVWELE